MKTEKDIDSIYRDRLKGAKVPPPQDAWENILSRLPEKEEKRKLFPLWIRLAGVAALLALIFTMFPGSNKSLSEGIRISSGTEKFNFSIPEVSATFNEVMRESNVLLQALILRSEEMELQEKQFKINAGGEEVVSRPAVLSEVNKSSGETYTLKGDDSGIVLSEESLSEDIASSNELAEVTPVQENNQPTDLALENDQSERKFRLSTRIAPVYFNSSGKGSTGENGVSQGATAGEVTFSYGVNIAYQVSEKINVRSGINKVDLAYSTPEVSYSAVAGTKSFGGKMMETTTLASPSSGILSQKMGFFEVPLEVEYILLDKKFTVGLIGGGSALILEENKVSLETFGDKTNIGGTGNMNKLSFTTNLGLSLAYNISGQVQLNLEPVVKLQMNTFKNSGDANPYFLGIYSGFSYRF